ncbi:MAG: hypothetical protein ACLTG4_07150 [Oscillospiraceae bacterium]
MCIQAIKSVGVKEYASELSGPRSRRSTAARSCRAPASCSR